MKIYAQIKDGVIQNTIVLDQPELLPLFTQHFDSIVQLTEDEVRPGIGWTYDGRDFTAPEDIPDQDPDSEEEIPPDPPPPDPKIGSTPDPDKIIK